MVSSSTRVYTITIPFKMNRVKWIRIGVGAPDRMINIRFLVGVMNGGVGGCWFIILTMRCVLTKMFWHKGSVRTTVLFGASIVENSRRACGKVVVPDVIDWLLSFRQLLGLSFFLGGLESK